MADAHTSTWRVILAFDEPSADHEDFGGEFREGDLVAGRATAGIRRAGIDRAGITEGEPQADHSASTSQDAHRDAYARTISALSEAIDPKLVTVILNEPDGEAPVADNGVPLTNACQTHAVRSLIQAHGMSVMSASGDLNSSLKRACLQAWADHPNLGIAIFVGPFPTVSRDDILAGLRACSACESAYVAADDGGTALLTHHDPQALIPRFGGLSAERHRRHAVAVTAPIPGLRKRNELPRRHPPSG